MTRNQFLNLKINDILYVKHYYGKIHVKILCFDENDYIISAATIKHGHRIHLSDKDIIRKIIMKPNYL